MFTYILTVLFVVVSSPVISFFSGLFEQSLSPFSPIPDNNTTADQWQVSNNITADQWQVFPSEGQNERIRMASNLQLSVSIVIILVSSVVVIVLVALINRRRLAGHRLGAATNRLASLGPEPRNQEERIPGRRVTFSRS